MVVGDDVAILGDDDSRAIGAVLLALHALVDDEAEERLIKRGKARLHGADMDDTINSLGSHLTEIGGNQIALNVIDRLSGDFLRTSRDDAQHEGNDTKDEG